MSNLDISDDSNLVFHDHLFRVTAKTQEEEPIGSA